MNAVSENGFSHNREEPRPQYFTHRLLQWYIRKKKLPKSVLGLDLPTHSAPPLARRMQILGKYLTVKLQVYHETNKFFFAVTAQLTLSGSPFTLHM